MRSCLVPPQAHAGQVYCADLVDAAVDPDPLARQAVGLNRHERRAQPLDVVQESVDQARWGQHCQTQFTQALYYLIDHRVPSVSMTSLFDTNARKREAESKKLVNGKPTQSGRAAPQTALSSHPELCLARARRLGFGSPLRLHVFGGQAWLRSQSAT